MNLQQTGGGNGYTNKYGKEYTEATVPVTQDWKTECSELFCNQFTKEYEWIDFIQSLLTKARESGFQEGKNYFRSLKIGENAEDVEKKSIQSYRQELRKKVDGMKEDYDGEHPEFNRGVHLTKKDLLTIISE
jgi:hypothetical protein